jgi:hypothetical protein
MITSIESFYENMRNLRYILFKEATDIYYSQAVEMTVCLKNILFVHKKVLILYYLKVPNKQFLEGFKQPMLTDIPAF